MPDEISASLASWSQNKGSASTGGRPANSKPTSQPVARQPQQQQATSDVAPQPLQQGFCHCWSVGSARFNVPLRNLKLNAKVCT